MSGMGVFGTQLVKLNMQGITQKIRLAQRLFLVGTPGRGIISQRMYINIILVLKTIKHRLSKNIIGITATWYGIH
jgi:hypothetical protein